MALAIALKGSDTSSPLSVGSLTISSGSTIVVTLYIDSGSTSTPTVTYNDGSDDYSLTLRRNHTNPSGTQVKIYSLDNTTAAAGSGTVSASSGNGISIYEITGAETSGAFDVNAGASGRSTTPSSGATATTAQDDEVVVGAISWRNESAPGGTYNGTCTENTSEISGGAHAMHSATKIVSSTGTYTMSKTGCIKDYWAAVVATFKAAAAAGGAPKRLMLMGVGD